MTADTGRSQRRSAQTPLRAVKQQQRAELREQMLGTAREIITEEGFDALSMRKLAQRLGCAPMSLYAYFGDKHALLLALAQESFELLAKRLAADKPDDPLDALEKVYEHYARLGFEKPEEYRIIFMTPETQPPRTAKSPLGIYQENPAFAVSLDRAQACIDAGVLHGDPHTIATVLWTTVHGAVAAILNFPAFPFGDPRAYVARVVELTLSALVANVVEPIV